ncbi:MAG: hypothetical protein U9R50_10990 [Campylobacterota bacterium]|nr:hypothetical protein [Campylobacterota bacterium]
MKKFNLHKEIIVCSRKELFTAINSAKAFAITIEGKISYEPFSKEDIYIYQGTIAKVNNSALSMPKPRTLNDMLGSSYSIVEDNERVLFKAAGAWTQIINFNTDNADYDDTSADGIADFSDAKLEDIGWHATEFDINYRELSEYLEAECDGTLLCVEIEEPYQFTGLGFISDRECAHTKLFDYCKERITHELANNPDFEPESLTDDEEEAAQFFNLL